jgi:hypothetical protein
MVQKRGAAKAKGAGSQTPENVTPPPMRLKVPEFLLDEDVGLGDFLKRATSLAGIVPCGGCERRAQRLNRRIVLVPRVLGSASGNAPIISPR